MAKFEKGHQKSGGRKVGSKNRATLLQDERRAVFDEEVSQFWRDNIKRLRPEYIADQFMGKSPTHLDITTLGEKIRAAEVSEEDQKDSEALGKAASLLMSLVIKEGMTFQQAEERFERWLMTKPTLASPGEMTWEEVTGEKP